MGLAGWGGAHTLLAVANASCQGGRAVLCTRARARKDAAVENPQTRRACSDLEQENQSVSHMRRGAQSQRRKGNEVKRHSQLWWA
jgi:hypothetical protein